MSIVGKKINLEVLRNTEIGLFLDTENREYDGILLPNLFTEILKIVLLPLDWSLIFALVNLPI